MLSLEVGYVTSEDPVTPQDSAAIHARTRYRPGLASRLRVLKQPMNRDSHLRAESYGDLIWLPLKAPTIHDDDLSCW